MRTLLFLLALAAVGAAWTLNRMTAANLRAELGALRQENADLDATRREQERLRALHAESAGRARDRARAPLESPAPAPPPTRSRSALEMGEWHPPGSWQNRGHATPSATVETALWAAGGGDLPVLQGLLHLDDAVRAKAETLRNQLPDTARVTYASAEHLLAAFATKSLPLGDAQLIWQHQPEIDEAFACLMVRNPDYVPTMQPARSLERNAYDPRGRHRPRRRPQGSTCERKAPAHGAIQRRQPLPLSRPAPHRRRLADRRVAAGRGQNCPGDCGAGTVMRAGSTLS